MLFLDICFFLRINILKVKHGKKKMRKKYTYMYSAIVFLVADNASQVKITS